MIRREGEIGRVLLMRLRANGPAQLRRRTDAAICATTSADRTSAVLRPPVDTRASSINAGSRLT